MRDLAASLEEEPPDLPMTPLIDMVFLLLSFFIFATQLRQELPGPEIRQPVLAGPAGVAAGQGQTWRVEIDRTGQVTLVRPASGGANGLERLAIATPAETDPEALAARLKPLAAGPKEALPALTMVVDKAVSYERLSEVLAAFRLAGFSKFKLSHLSKPSPAP